MKLDFYINNIHGNKITLLDCQVELILRSLEFYCYTYQFIYPRVGKNRTKEENLRVHLVRDTYHQILEQYTNKNYRATKIDLLEEFEDNFKNVA